MKKFGKYVLACAAIGMAACGGSGGGNFFDQGSNNSAVATAQFIAMAKAAQCSDYRNRLYLIDQKQVLWDVAGNCPDNGNMQRLFGSTVDLVLCTQADSIAGPVISCADETARLLFAIMLNNLDKPDLGLGPLHQVQRIVF